LRCMAILDVSGAEAVVELSQSAVGFLA
jgi:hypothetical protein